MSASIRQGARTELWQQAVREAEQRANRTLDELRESYLVFVLSRHQEDTQLLARIQTLEWLSAQAGTGTARADALRDVGDRCLLIAGLFPGLAERRRVSADYYIGLGRGAYGEVAHCSRAGYAELFQSLAQSYHELVLVLRKLRPANSGPCALPRVGLQKLESESTFSIKRDGGV